MARDPSFSILYADLKSGKTSDVLAAFPRAVYIAAPGALECSKELWGFEVPVRNDLETFTDVRHFAERMTSRDGVALVADDATLIADRTANYFAAKGMSGWDVWAAVLSAAVRMRDTLRRRGFHIAMTCHPRAAHMENGVRIRGGPSFQGQCSMKIPAAADLLLRAEARPGIGGAAGDLGLGLTPAAPNGAPVISSGAPAPAPAAPAKPQVFGWPMVYRTAYHPDWMQGSRYDTPDMSPMNLGEILRLAGFALPRLPGLEWQEAVANALAQKLLEQPGLTDSAYVRGCLSKVKDRCLSSITKNEAHVYWAIRDGYDRAVLRVASAGRRRDMWGV